MIDCRPWPLDHLYQFWLSNVVGEEEGTFITKEKGFSCKRLMSNAATRCGICSLCKLDKVGCDIHLGEFFFFFFFADLSDVFGDMLNE